MKRIVYKISGESLSNREDNINYDKLTEVCNDIKKLYDNNLQLIIIIGGGNLFRGRNLDKINKVNADYMGMLATTMNSIALFDRLKSMNLKVKLYNSFLIDGMIDTYNINKCLDEINDNNILIIGGGSRLPFCTTDFACVQRAIELEADTILFSKSIDYIYDKDPKLGNAIKYDEISSLDIIKNQINIGLDKLGVIDINAATLMNKYHIKGLLFDTNDENKIDKIINNQDIGTKIV